MKRARVSAVTAAAPGKVKPSAIVGVPPKAFASAAAARVEPKEDRFKLRRPDPPVEIFKHVGYTHRGASQRTLASGSVRPTTTVEIAVAGTGGALPSMSLVFEEAAGWIEAHCAIPSDFERPTRFGPLSGSTYAERIVQAFSLGLLTTKHEVSYPQALEKLVDAGFAEQKAHLMLQPVEGSAPRAELLLSA